MAFNKLKNMAPR